jgi:hypothetical protein
MQKFADRLLAGKRYVEYVAHFSLRFRPGSITAKTTK